MRYFRVMQKKFPKLNEEMKIICRKRKREDSSSTAAPEIGSLKKWLDFVSGDTEGKWQINRNTYTERLSHEDNGCSIALGC